jgi:hypothetical protein
MATRQINIDQFIETLNDLEKKEIPFALARALQDIGQIGKRAIQANINNNVDNPTKFTRQAAFATKVQKGESSVTFGVRDYQGSYLFSLYAGGQRELKPFESRFAIATKGGPKYLVPASGTDGLRDAEGNVPLALVKRIMEGAKERPGKFGYYMTKRQIRYRPAGGESTPVYNLRTKSEGFAYVPRLSIEPAIDASMDAFPDLFKQYLEDGIEDSLESGRYRK